MTIKPDILLGILAWCLSLTTLILKYFPVGFEMCNGLLIVPGLWIACMVAMHRMRRRSAWHFWWVWPSIVLTFGYWFPLGIWMVFGKFAP